MVVGRVGPDGPVLVEGVGPVADDGAVALGRPGRRGAGEGAPAAAVVGDDGRAEDVAGRGRRGGVDPDGGVEGGWVVLDGLALEVDRDPVAGVDSLAGLDLSLAVGGRHGQRGGA